MQVLLINGSPHPKGSTATALATVARQLEKAGIETTTLHVGHKAIRGCIACGKCAQTGLCVFKDDPVNECIERMREADGLYDGEDSVLHCDKLRQLDSSARHTVDILLAPARLRYDHGGQSVMAGRIIWRVVAAADHPLSRIRGSLSLDDLLRHRQLLPLPGVISSDAFYDSFRLSSHLVHYSQFYQLQEMLLAGMGFAVFPAQLARPFVEQGRLKLLELDFDDGISTTAVELAWVEPLGTAGRWLVERLRELPPEEGGR